MVTTSAPLPTTTEFINLGSKVSSERGVARKNACCQPVFLQPEKSIHLKEPGTHIRV